MILPGLMALLAVVNADSADIASIQKQLAPVSVIRGHFEQSKKIKIIQRPLVSRGAFVLAKGKGLIWQTATPVASVLRITPQKIVQMKDGKDTVLVSTREQPGLAVVGNILFAVFSADMGAFKEHFTFDAASAPAGRPWKLVLTPKDTGVAKVIGSIEVTGLRTVDAVQLSEANGDVTHLQFIDVADDKTLTSQEAVLLD